MVVGDATVLTVLVTNFLAPGFDRMPGTAQIEHPRAEPIDAQLHPGLQRVDVAMLLKIGEQPLILRLHLSISQNEGEANSSSSACNYSQAGHPDWDRPCIAWRRTPN